MNGGWFRRLGFRWSRYHINTPIEVTYRLRWRMLEHLVRRVPFANDLKAILFQVPLGSRCIEESLNVSERIVEYPQVFANLHLETGTVCDLGSAGSKLPLELASLGLRVTAVDHKAQYFDHPNLSYVRADLTRLPFRSRSFDRVLAISTIEHVGLGEFSDPVHPDGDVVAMAEARRLVKDSGRVFVSFLVVDPAIEYAWHGKIHHYSPSRIQKLLEAFTIEKRFTFGFEDGHWRAVGALSPFSCVFFVLQPR